MIPFTVIVGETKLKGASVYHHLRHNEKKDCLRKHRIKGRGLISGRIDIDCRSEIVEHKLCVLQTGS